MSKTLKIGIFVLIFLSAALGVILALDFPKNKPALSQAVGTETPGSVVPGEEDLIEAVETALANSTGRWAEFTYEIDHIQVQDDGQMAIVWLAAVDPESGEFLGREPELALAVKSEKGEWDVLLEDDSDFGETFKSFQYADKNILDGDILTGAQKALPRGDGVFGGYYLPWAAGLEKRLTWSVGHTSCYPIYYCTHAFDFADGTMFPMVAAKGGTVFHWHDSCANGDSSCSNSITIQDKSTTPWTYQIYLHIAQDSVPDNLKQVGTPVMQGQYIANVDDTGYSSGHHVHFMVVTENTRYFSYSMNSIWGVAEDITFKDVDINWDSVTQGGRPRLAYEAATYGGEGRTYYVSGNKPANPPTGGYSEPAGRTVLTDQILTVKGWARDDVGITKAEILANYAGEWVTIGEAPGGSNFTANIDMCETDVPDGYFALAVRVWDYEGNPSSIIGPRRLFNNVDCSVDPDVRFGSRFLPETGYLRAYVTTGSSGSAIKSVEFWFFGKDLFSDERVFLGRDYNGDNGWRVPISTADMEEANNYILYALARDADGNQGSRLIFNATVDRTEPWLELEEVQSPIMEDTVTLTWRAWDKVSGLDHFYLSVRNGNGVYQVLENNLSRTLRSYAFDVVPNQFYFVRLTAYDRAGHKVTQKIELFTEGFEWDYEILLFPVYKEY